MEHEPYPVNTSEVIPDDQYQNLMAIEDNRFAQDFRFRKLYIEGAGVGFSIVGAATGVAREETTIADVNKNIDNGIEGAFVANNIALGVAAVAVMGAYGIRRSLRQRHLLAAAQRMDRRLRGKEIPGFTADQE